MQYLGNIESLSKYMFFPDSRKGGFTLIEVIIFLVMLSILAAMIASFFGATFINSTVPIIMLNEQYSNDAKNPGVFESMEKIIADYKLAPDKVSFTPSTSANYNASLSKDSLDLDSVPGIKNTGTSLVFEKVVVSRNDQKIMALFPFHK